MPWVERLDDPVALARDLQRSCRVLFTPHLFRDIGLRIDVTMTGLEIRPGSPEAMLRLAALCAKGAILAIDPGGHGPRPRAFIKLRPLADGPIVLPTVLTSTSAYPYPWLELPAPVQVETGKAERRAIASWLPVHDTWANDLDDFL